MTKRGQIYFTIYTYSGTPQGSGASPLLANLYLHELDRHMEEYKRQFDKDKCRQTSRDYRRIQGTHQYRKEKYNRLWSTLTEDEKKAASREIKCSPAQTDAKIPSKQSDGWKLPQNPIPALCR